MLRPAVPVERVRAIESALEFTVKVLEGDSVVDAFCADNLI
jgi:hypothetical protein